mmetsp:Transcript_7162/g.14955  ORF Transcript_7162/g.14955 Transcript_7162/m.14955 type:complete len:215 (+) Transcript_7162:438-1082(+)
MPLVINAHQGTAIFLRYNGQTHQLMLSHQGGRITRTGIGIHHVDGTFQSLTYIPHCGYHRHAGLGSGSRHQISLLGQTTCGGHMSLIQLGRLGQEHKGRIFPRHGTGVRGAGGLMITVTVHGQRQEIHGVQNAHHLLLGGRVWNLGFGTTAGSWCGSRCHSGRWDFLFVHHHGTFPTTLHHECHGSTTGHVGGDHLFGMFVFLGFRGSFMHGSK